MKKSSIIIIFISCLVLFLSSFFYGYYFTGKNISKKPNSNDTVIDDRVSDNNGLEIIKEEGRISPNTSIEKEIYYTECRHTIKDKLKVNNEMINMNEKEFYYYIKKNYPNLNIVSFSVSNIILKENRETLCPNHYIIGESDGKIAVYRISEDGDKILYKILEDYSLTLLKEIDQEKLKKGIVVDTEEELSDVLESFISWEVAKLEFYNLAFLFICWNMLK